MKIIGLTGGVAGGKSLVAEQFVRLGAGLLDADKAGHEALRLPRVEQAAKERWGTEVLGADGRIDRAKLARVVFGANAATEREYLEQLTHPEIGRLLRQKAEALAAEGKAAAVLDAALLTEAGWDRWCDKIVFVDAPREARLARALARGWSKEDFAAREAAQYSLESKRRRADLILDNSGPPERTQAQVEQFWASLFR